LSVDDFDEQGRVVQRVAESDEGSELLTYSAGGLLTKRSYGDGHVIEHQYDSLGRLVTMVSAASSANDKRALFTRFSDFTQGTLPGTMKTKQKGEESFTYDVFGAVVLSEQSVKSLKLREWSSELHASVDAVRIKRTRLSDYTYGATTTIDEYNAVQSPSAGTMQRWLTRDVSTEGRVLSEHDHKDDTKITYEYERDSRGMIAKTTRVAGPLRSSSRRKALACRRWSACPRRRTRNQQAFSRFNPSTTAANSVAASCQTSSIRSSSARMTARRQGPSFGSPPNVQQT
jgi:YD repeat-containing protein